MTTRLLVTVTDGSPPQDALLAVVMRLGGLRCHVEQLGPEEPTETATEPTGPTGDAL